MPHVSFFVKSGQVERCFRKGASNYWSITLELPSSSWTETGLPESTRRDMEACKTGVPPAQANESHTTKQDSHIQGVPGTMNRGQGCLPLSQQLSSYQARSARWHVIPGNLCRQNWSRPWVISHLLKCIGSCHPLCYLPSSALKTRTSLNAAAVPKGQEEQKDRCRPGHMAAVLQPLHGCPLHNLSRHVAPDVGVCQHYHPGAAAVSWGWLADIRPDVPDSMLPPDATQNGEC